jgi:D-alanine-D-alanine ligase
MTKNNLRVGIIYGGKSAEHDVSIQSAKNVLSNIDKNKYEPIPIYIDKVGKWFLDKSRARANLKTYDLNRLIDVAFPIMHGPFGEDGAIQGLLRLLDIPFVGASTLGSAVGMDKDVMKRLLKESGIRTARFIALHSHIPVDFESTSETLGLPMFVKPANLGSSVGISKITNKANFEQAIQKAFTYDSKILVEQFIEGREIECAVLGNENPVASTVGEIVTAHDFYSYESKYTDTVGTTLVIPAKLSQDQIKEIQNLSIRIFQTLSCEGLARIDFFLTIQGQVVTNEINTMPGFTSSSMYPRLWQASGVSYTELITRLIELGLTRFKKEQKLINTYTAL